MYYFNNSSVLFYPYLSITRDKVLAYSGFWENLKENFLPYMKEKSNLVLKKLA